MSMLLMPSMLSNSLSPIQWNSLCTNQIFKSLTSTLRLETVCQISMVTGGAFIRNDNVSIKISVDGGNEIEVNKVNSQKKYS